jgi:hypothetical protein
VLRSFRKLEGLDADQQQQQLRRYCQGRQTANKATEVASQVYDDVKGFFSAVGGFFSNIFGTQTN